MCIVYTTFSVVIWSSNLLVIVRKSIGEFMSTTGAAAVNQKSTCLLHCSPKPYGEVPRDHFCPGQCRSCLSRDPSPGPPTTNHPQTLPLYFRFTLATHQIGTAALRTWTQGRLFSKKIGGHEGTGAAEHPRASLGWDLSSPHPQTVRCQAYLANAAIVAKDHLNMLSRSDRH